MQTDFGKEEERRIKSWKNKRKVRNTSVRNRTHWKISQCPGGEVRKKICQGLKMHLHSEVRRFCAGLLDVWMCYTLLTTDHTSWLLCNRLRANVFALSSEALWGDNDLKFAGFQVWGSHGSGFIREMAWVEIMLSGLLLGLLWPVISPVQTLETAWNETFQGKPVDWKCSQAQCLATYGVWLAGRKLGSF